MDKQTKDDIIDILLAIYGFPGQYLIGALILRALYTAMKDMTPWSFLLIVFMIIFVVLEVLTPILAGERLIIRVKNNFRKIFDKKKN